MIELLAAAQLYLCTYVNNETPPRIFSVTHADQNVAQGNAEECCFRYCIKAGCECEFKGCKRWSPNGEQSQ